MAGSESPQHHVIPRREVIAAAGVLMQTLLGTVYAWSVFKKPLMEAHGWTSGQVGLTFTLVIFCIGAAAALGGRFVDRAGAGRVAGLAAAMFGVGTLLAGVAAHWGLLWLLWLGYGIIGGLGNGLGYVTPVAVLVRWFPDKRGFITGITVMGFGLGAAITGQIAPLLIKSIGLSATFFLMGAVVTVLLSLAATRMTNPPAGWQPPGWQPAESQAAAAAQACDLRASLRMYQFYLLWGTLFINVTAGIALISNLSPMAQSQIGFSPVAAGTVVFVASLCNGLGRIFWSWISDRTGRKRVFLLILGTQGAPAATAPRRHQPVGLCRYLLLHPAVLRRRLLHHARLRGRYLRTAVPGRHLRQGAAGLGGGRRRRTAAHGVRPAPVGQLCRGAVHRRRPAAGWLRPGLHLPPPTTGGGSRDDRFQMSHRKQAFAMFSPVRG